MGDERVSVLCWCGSLDGMGGMEGTPMKVWKVVLTFALAAVILGLSAACQVAYKNSSIERIEFPEDDVVCYYIQAGLHAEALSCVVEE